MAYFNLDAENKGATERLNKPEGRRKKPRKWTKKELARRRERTADPTRQTWSNNGLSPGDGWGKWGGNPSKGKAKGKGKGKCTGKGKDAQSTKGKGAKGKAKGGQGDWKGWTYSKNAENYGGSRPKGKGKGKSAK